MMSLAIVTNGVVKVQGQVINQIHNRSHDSRGEGDNLARSTCAKGKTSAAKV